MQKCAEPRTHHRTSIQYQVASHGVDGCWRIESGPHDQRKRNKQATREGEEEHGDEVDDEDVVRHFEVFLVTDDGTASTGRFGGDEWKATTSVYTNGRTELK